jgi:hypothetical protein
VLFLAFILMALAPAPLHAGEKASSDLQWHAHGVSAARTALPLDARSDTTLAARPRAGRVDLRWTNRGMARQPVRPNPRPAILQVSGYEDAPPPQDEASQASDPDAHKDPFYVADQRAKSNGPPESTGELPIPDSSPSIAAESTGELPIPESSGTPVESASQLPIPDKTDPADEPMPLKRTEDDLFPDAVPTHPDADLPLPSGDLSEGMATAPGGVGCKGYADQCRRALRELQGRDITTVVVGVVIEGTEGDDYPCDCSLGRDFDAPKYVARNFSPTLFTWKAASLCHKPLYFEDVQLERYGHSWNPIIQPFMSGAHFFVSVPLLPYKMGLKPPHECVYTLGYYRPGNCAPYMFEPIPLSLRAAVWEAAGITAFAFWFWPPN